MDYFTPSNASDAFLTFLTVFLIIFAVIMLVGAVFWVLRSMALYALAKNRGMSNPGLAWIPWVGSYRIGSIADNIAVTEGSKTYYGGLLLGGMILSFVISGVTMGMYVPLFNQVNQDFYTNAFGYGGAMTAAFSAISSISGFAGLALYVIQIIALNKIFKNYNPQSATAWTILSAIPFTAFLFPIFLFIIRNRAPVTQWGAPGGYGQGYPPAGYPPPGYPPQQGYAPYQQPTEGYYAPPHDYPPPPFQPPASGAAQQAIPPNPESGEARDRSREDN